VEEKLSCKRNLEFLDLNSGNKCEAFLANLRFSSNMRKVIQGSVFPTESMDLKITSIVVTLSTVHWVVNLHYNLSEKLKPQSDIKPAQWIIKNNASANSPPNTRKLLHTRLPGYSSHNEIRFDQN